MGRTVVESLGHAIKRSDYRALLARGVTALGFLADDEAVILRSDPETMRMKFEPCASIRDAKVQAWAVVDKRKLLALDERASLPIEMRPAGSTPVPTKLARLVQRTFQAPGFEAPLTERRDLVYATMFGDDVSVLLGSKSGTLEVLRYRNGLRGLDVAVTSGISNPERAPTEFFRNLDPRAMGAGYELIALCEPGDTRVSDQLGAMVRVSASRAEHLLPSEWVWLNGECLADSDIGGFLILAPTTFPEVFPVGNGLAHFTLLLPVTMAEVQYARRTRVLEVAKLLASHGIRDTGPLRRASVPGVPPYEPPPPEPPEPEGGGLLDMFNDETTRVLGALQRVMTRAPSFQALVALAPPVVFFIGEHAFDFDVDSAGTKIAMTSHDPRHPRASARVRVHVDRNVLLGGQGPVPIRIELPQNPGRDVATAVALLSACFSNETATH